MGWKGAMETDTKSWVLEDPIWEFTGDGVSKGILKISPFLFPDDY